MTNHATRLAVMRREIEAKSGSVSAGPGMSWADFDALVALVEDAERGIVTPAVVQQREVLARAWDGASRAAHTATRTEAAPHA